MNYNPRKNNTEADCMILYRLLSRGHDVTRAELLKHMSTRRLILALRESREFGDRTWKVGTVNGKPPTYTIVWRRATAADDRARLAGYQEGTGIV